MARGGYAPLPNTHESRFSTAEDEMERAFESDNEDQDTTPLTRRSTPPTPAVAPSQEGIYDFEREYDHPPPGSPPATASPPIPFGNSNGIIPSPSSIMRRDIGALGARPSFFRRAVGALLPQHYARIPTSEAEVRGGGIENDGVFSNVAARPTPPRTVQDENGDVHFMPEDAQKDVPPSYAAAQADTAPPYWETTVHAPAFGGADDLLIEGFPAGSILSFAWNFLISFSFQFVGFMLTYLLHTSHAAKYGSRAGLGVTLIQLGLYNKASDDQDIFGDGPEVEVGVTTVSGQALRLARRGYSSLSPRSWMMSSSSGSDESSGMMSSDAMHDWISFMLMTLGWILLLSSLLGFARVKRWERSIRTPTPAPLPTRIDPQRDAQLRLQLRDAFGVYVETEEEAEEARRAALNPEMRALSAQEERMREDLHRAGLI